MTIRMKKVWFTADLHLGHKNIIKYCNRPFRDVNEMNKSLIENWNSRVGLNDDVWVLGDFSFADKDDTANFVGALNGAKFLIKGNHDRINQFYPKAFLLQTDYYEFKHEGELITLCHYPFHSWNKSYHGSWHLHGHCHGTVPAPEGMRRLDVGVDCHNYAPISFDEIKEHMSKIIITKHKDKNK